MKNDSCALFFGRCNKKAYLCKSMQVNACLCKSMQVNACRCKSIPVNATQCISYFQHLCNLSLPLGFIVLPPPWNVVNDKKKYNFSQNYAILHVVSCRIGLFIIHLRQFSYHKMEISQMSHSKHGKLFVARNFPIFFELTRKLILRIVCL